jgi:hypothetical protein
MGIKRQASYRDYWSSAPDLNDAYISKLMSVNRYGWLLSNIHLNDNTLMPKRGDPNFDKLYEVRPFIDALQKNFLKCYDPDDVMSVDESMILFKGCSSLKQYMPKKPIRRGYKVWMLACKSAYELKFEVYTGKKGDAVQKNLGESVVKSMMEGLEGANHKVFFDNYFTTYELLKSLKEKEIYACGTVNINRKVFPKFPNAIKMSRGQHEWFCSSDGVSVVAWKDNKPVLAATNFIDPEPVTRVNRKSKDGTIQQITCPELINIYNMNMNCVDHFGQLKSLYEINRKSKKWWHRIFFFFLDTAVVNAFILHKQFADSDETERFPA